MNPALYESPTCSSNPVKTHIPRLNMRSYSPFGNIDYSKGSSDNNIQFTGKEIDPESGLTYFGARYYNPIIGQWISKDNIAGKINIPQGLNRYQYCYNNPLKFIDPDGNKITLKGKKKEKKEFIKIVKETTGYTVEETKKGELKIKGKRDTSKGVNKAAKILKLAIEPKDVIDLELVTGDFVFIDAWISAGKAKVDVGDLSGFINKSTRLGAVALSHILNEQAYAITKGTGRSPAHANANKIEASFFGGVWATATFRPGYISGDSLKIEYLNSRYRGRVIRTFNLKLDKKLTPK